MDKGIIHPNASISKLIFGSLLFMSLGIVLELYLLGHFEGILQAIPILCICTSIFLVVTLWFKTSRLLIKLFQIFLTISALSGLYGVFLHLQANYEFESEINSRDGFWQHFTDSFFGALPVLAPGSMILFALIGYVYLLMIKQKQ